MYSTPGPQSVKLRIARADANPDESIDWADLRAQLMAK
jgi:hypothetical protein